LIDLLIDYNSSRPQTCIKYSLDFLRPITCRTAEVFEAVDWLADLPQRTWLQAGRWSSGVFWRHFVEVNSRNHGGGHVCWGSYDGLNFAGWRGGCGVGHGYITMSHN